MARCFPFKRRDAKSGQNKQTAFNAGNAKGSLTNGEAEGSKIVTGQDAQCERELIALMLSSDKALIKAVCELTADDFTRQDLKQIFIMICEMYEEKQEGRYYLFVR